MVFGDEDLLCVWLDNKFCLAVGEYRAQWLFQWPFGCRIGVPNSRPRVAWGWLSLLYPVFTGSFIVKGLRAVQLLFFREGSI